MAWPSVRAAPTRAGPPVPPPAVETDRRRSPRTGRRVATGRILLGILSGLAQFATFPPRSWWPLGAVGVALFVLAVRGTRPRLALLIGFACGAGLFVPLLTWLRVVGVDAWLLLAASQAVFFALLGLLTAWAARLPGWPVWTACLWVTQEWARSRVPFGGFSWGRLAFGQAHSPLTPYAAIGGAPLVTFAVALGGGLLAAALVAASRRRTVVAAGLSAGVAAVAGCGLAVPLPTAGQASAAGPATAVVAVVQGNVPRLGLNMFAQSDSVLANHVAGTASLAHQVAAGRLPAPDFVVWPEDVSSVDPLDHPALRAEIQQAVSGIGRPVLVGVVLDGPGPTHARNAGIVWDPTTGPGQVYVKRHPVPFGEYVPFRSVLGRFIGRFALVPKDFVAGRRVGVMQLGPVRVGDVICFEVAYDSIVRDAVNAGGRIIVVQTNDATFETAGASNRVGESAQQLAISRLRAVEHGRTVVIAATSGVSAVIAPDGRILARSPVFAPALFDLRVPLRDTRTVADRVGAVPEWTLALLGLAAGLGGWAVGRRRVHARDAGRHGVGAAG